MENTKAKDLAEEMASFCRERVSARAESARRSSIPKKVLRGVITSLLAAPMALSGRASLKKARWH